jgi:outer membrane receptor protein involved in Fe transport
VEGKLGSWDLTYAGAYLARKDFQSSDYTDYAEAYDSYYAAQGGLAGYFYFLDNAGNTIDPRQVVISTDHFKKMSHELRIASPSSAPLRFVGGLFWQRQSNFIHQDYQVPGLGDLESVNGSPGTLWLTQQKRVDRDYAMFGELSYDVAPKVTLTAGLRGFIYNNTLVGFFGFGRNPGNGYTDSPYNGAGSSKTGVVQCFTTDGNRLYDNLANGTGSTTLLPGVVPGSPCTNLGVYAGNGVVDPVKADGSGVTYRFNATYKPNSNLMLYATVSRGFRPGGINRRGDFGPYQPDYLLNYELGFKSTLMNGALRINGAVYQQDWNHFQFSYLGPNSFTVIVNGPNARIRGFDLDATVIAGGFTFNAAAAYTDGKIRQNLCHAIDPTFQCDPAGGNPIDAPAGTRLPITPQFKISGTARYTVPMGQAKVYGQVNGSYQSSASSDLRVDFASSIGRLPAYGLVNLAFGAEWDKLSIELFASNVFDERGQLSRFIQCGECTQRPYIVPTTPRTLGVRLGTKF